MKAISKRKVIEAIRKELEKSIDLSELGRKTANTDAIESEGRMQTRYGSAKEESQNLEAAYQKKKAVLEVQIQVLCGIEANIPSTTVRSGCLVDLDCSGGTQCVFISPIGGIDVVVEDTMITAISLTTPLSKIILRKKVGDQMMLPNGERATISRIE